ncbi:IMPACT family protein [Microbulbifer sp. 2201CG32-9]|uniref:IMPACT family protein n=1 Tax=Microbulbifer sp. 2201CG32-9 TaxID=3232309 RepID=UPI00345BFB0E
MSYQIPCCPVVSESEEKKSRFICWFGPVSSKVVFQRQLALAQAQFPHASHHCTALILGDPANPESMQADDDGEPSGSAGKPMLELLVKHRIGDVGVIVTRFFGGTKLGVGGLVRAYRGSVNGALRQVELKPFVSLRAVSVCCDFALESRVRFLLQHCGGQCVDAVYSDRVQIDIRVPESQWAQLYERLTAAGAEVTIQ